MPPGKSTRAAAEDRARGDRRRSAARRICAGRDFYAVGGTWRAFAKLHMRQRNYPLQIMHGYVISARDAADFADLLARVDSDALDAIAIGLGAAPPAARLCRRSCWRRSSAARSRARLSFRRPACARACCSNGSTPPSSFRIRFCRRREQFNFLRSRAPASRARTADVDRRVLEEHEARRFPGRDAVAARIVPYGRHRMARTSGLSRRAGVRTHRQRGGAAASIIRAAPSSRSRMRSATTA